MRFRTTIDRSLRSASAWWKLSAGWPRVVLACVAALIAAAWIVTSIGCTGAEAAATARTIEDLHQAVASLEATLAAEVTGVKTGDLSVTGGAGDDSVSDWIRELGRIAASVGSSILMYMGVIKPLVKRSREADLERFVDGVIDKKAGG